MRPLQPDDPVRIGRYELEGILGTGGMGTVYFGRSPGGRPAAVKVINPAYLSHPEALARFRREAETLGTVRSAYTATLIDSELTTPPHWMATEYIPGPTLADTVAEDGPMSPRWSVRLMAALAEGLGDIHAHGICHRDLKPQNVILSSTGPQLIDFGIARSLGQSGLTLTGVTLGTPGYIAPELMATDELTPAADIFALGATITHAATARRPYGGGTLETIYLRLLQEDIDLDGVDPGLADLIRACVAKEPTERPTPDEIIDWCRNLRDGAAAPVRERSIGSMSTEIPRERAAGPASAAAGQSRAEQPRRAAEDPAGAGPFGRTPAGAGPGAPAAAAGGPQSPAGPRAAADGFGPRPPADGFGPRPPADGFGPRASAGRSFASAGWDDETGTGDVPERGRPRRRLALVGASTLAAVLLFAGGGFAALRIMPKADVQTARQPAPAISSTADGAARSASPPAKRSSAPSSSAPVAKPKPKPTPSKAAEKPQAPADSAVTTPTTADGRCIVLPAKVIDGAQVSAARCDGSAAQAWRFTKEGALISGAGKKCLDIGGNAGADIKYRVQVWGCSFNQAQVWVREPDDTLFNTQSGRCLGVLPAGEGGPALGLVTCTATAGQRWTLPS